MNSVLAIIALTLAGQPTTMLQRQHHDDTIYTVRGTAEQLAHFQADVGSSWKGGTLLTKDDGLYRYWAFPDRTAPQAREFMFAAMRSGLFLDIIAYDERISFRAERTSLDQLAVSCGFASDPFFITPAGELKITFDAADAGAIRCANDKLHASELRNMIKAPAK